MKKAILFSILLVSVGTNIFFIFSSNKKQNSGPCRLGDDKRISIAVKTEHKEFVMHEMRTFIESLSLISDRMTAGDTGKIIKAGRRSGIHVDPPKELVQSLPKNFLQMGRPAHRLFEAIADSAANNFNPATTQRQINMLLVKCTACHSTYRFDVK